MPKVTFFSVAVLLSLSLSALASDVCDDLWFARNSIMNQSGYCFSSNLGQKTFDNSDCHTKHPALTKSNRNRVAEIMSVERAFSCEIDTTKSDLDIHLFTIRKTLTVQPLNDGAESSCIGYNGAEQVPLYSDTDSSSEIIGFILPGDDLGYDHNPYSDTRPGWFFVSSVSYGGISKPVLGWTNSKALNQCDDFAG